MANTGMDETENDNEELQITHDDITEHIPLRRMNKLHNLKGNPQKKNRSRLDLGKDRKTMWFKRPILAFSHLMIHLS